jgi:hypothetical protein
LLPCPVPTLVEDNVEVKKNAAWSGPLSTTNILPERKLLHARCA